MGENLEIDGDLLFDALAKFFEEITDVATKLMKGEINKDEYTGKVISLTDGLNKDILVKCKREKKLIVESSAVEVDWS